MREKSIWDKIPIIGVYRERNALKEEVKQLELRIVRNQRQISGLESRINKFKKDFALFEKFKQFALEDFKKINAEYDKLEERYSVTVDVLKHRIATILDIARTYKFGANDFAMNMLAGTLEGANIGAIIFDEEKINYVTSYVSEKLDLSEDELIGSYFKDIFEGNSLKEFNVLGPKHPLRAKKIEKDFAGILFNFTMGHDVKTKKFKQYRAIWLVDDQKIGLSGYFKGSTVAMPKNISIAIAKKHVGDYLNACISTFAKRKTLTLECNNSSNMDLDAAKYLKTVCESSVSCRIIIRHPNERIYNMLNMAGFPEYNIRAYSRKASKELRVRTQAFGYGFSQA